MSEIIYLEVDKNKKFKSCKKELYDWTIGSFDVYQNIKYKLKNSNVSFVYMSHTDKSMDILIEKIDSLELITIQDDNACKRYNPYELFMHYAELDTCDDIVTKLIPCESIKDFVII